MKYIWIGVGFILPGLLLAYDGPGIPVPSKKATFLNSKMSSSSFPDRLFGAGGQTSVLQLSGSYPALIGFGLNAMYSPDAESNVYFADFNYYLPDSKTTYVQAIANDFTTTSPPSLTVPLKNKLSGLAVKLGYRRYLFNTLYDEGFRMYMQASIGIMYFNQTYTTSGFNPNLYTANYTPGGSISGYPLSIGGGAEYTTDLKLGFFADVYINAPLSFFTGLVQERNLPFSAQLNLGVRYHFLD